MINDNKKMHHKTNTTQDLQSLKLQVKTPSKDKIEIKKEDEIA